MRFSSPCADNPSRSFMQFRRRIQSSIICKELSGVIAGSSFIFFVKEWVLSPVFSVPQRESFERGRMKERKKDCRYTLWTIIQSFFHFPRLKPMEECSAASWRKG
jgi:hypothetical protein